MNTRYTVRTALVVLGLHIFFFRMAFPDTSPLARQNPVLRDHFLQLYLNTRPPPDFLGGRYYEAEILFLERYVDRLVDDFLTQVNERLSRLEEHFGEVLQARERMLDASGENDERRQEVRWKHSLEAMADEADDLRKMISHVLRGLDSKTDFKPVIHVQAGSSGYHHEINFIEEQLEKAERRIQNYFLSPTHTVHIQDLKGENMMIYLYRIRKMAEKLSQESLSG